VLKARSLAPMISLLYHSHTVVPAHLSELEALGLVEPDEQILVALDGVLLDGDGQRLSGPTLHDYCLVTTLRVLLWARDYGRHLCYAFPLAELVACEGAGVDPFHGTLEMTFAAVEEDEPEERFTLMLLPLVSLHAALSLLRAAATTARSMAEQGFEAREAGSEVLAVLSEQIFGHVDGLRPGETPYRWPGAALRLDPGQPGRVSVPLTPAPAFQHDPANLPPGQIYAAGRLARTAWDTLRRSIKDADLPFDLNSGSLRELTDAVRAINDLVHTVSSNPAAQQMAMAFINRTAGNRAAPAAQQEAEAPAGQAPRPAPRAPWAVPEPVPEPADEPAVREYREIPLRRRGTSSDVPVAEPAAAPRAVQRPAPPPAPAPEPTPDRREIPLRHRGPALAARAIALNKPKPIGVSGSGDADHEERPSTTEERR
jgi:hypothetical protein